MPDGGAPSPLSILVLDDDEAVLNSLAFALEAEGIRAITFSSADTLLRYDLAAESDCLVIDYRLPGMNGLELIDELRRRGIGIPAILITSNPTRQLLAAAERVHVPIVEKPLMGSALSSAIRQLCDCGKRAVPS